MVRGGFNLLAALCEIQPLSQQNRKKAFIASSFFLAATFRLGHVSRKSLSSANSNCLRNFLPV